MSKLDFGELSYIFGVCIWKKFFYYKEYYGLKLRRFVLFLLVSFSLYIWVFLKVFELSRFFIDILILEIVYFFLRLGVY